MRQLTNFSYHLLVPLLAVLLCIQITSCSRCTPGPEPKACACEECAVDSCNKGNCLCDEDICKKIDVKLASTVIFIDGSVSMQGYITPSVITNFSAVASAIEGLVPDSCSEYIFKKNKERISGINLSKQISEKKLNLDGKESNLGAMLSEMINGVKDSPSSVYFLITDGILSTTDDNIRNNREWNRVHRDLLQSDIENILRRGKNNVASIVLQYEAPFKGKYTAYNNLDKTYLDNQIRPYYVIAIGQPSVIQQVYKEITNGTHSGFDGIKNTALYGFDFELDQPTVEEDESIIYNENGYKVLSTAEKVVIAYDISKLPQCILEEKDSLNSHVRIITNGENGERSELMNGKQFTVEPDSTKLTLTITIRDKYDLGVLPVELEIGIAWWQPNWIEKCTTDDDKKPDTSRTFILKHFLYPFSQLNRGEGSGYVDNKHVIKLIK